MVMFYWFYSPVLKQFKITISKIWFMLQCSCPHDGNLVEREICVNLHVFHISNNSHCDLFHSGIEWLYDHDQSVAWEIETQRERQAGRQMKEQRETERDRERKAGRQAGRQMKEQRETERQREKGRQAGRKMKEQRETERERDRQANRCTGIFMYMYILTLWN